MFFLKYNNDFFLVFKFSNIIVSKNDNFKGFLFCLDFFFFLLKIKEYFFCHRLDKEVSGILLIVRKCFFLNLIKKIFFLKNFEKFYISFNYGISYLNFKINNKILLTFFKKNKSKQSISKFGKHSISKFFIIYRRLFFSVFNISIFSGKTHQIRFHFSIKGFPIINDSLYGSFFLLNYIFLFFYSINFFFIRNIIYKVVRIFIPPFFLFFFFKKKNNFFFLFFNFKFS